MSILQISEGLTPKEVFTGLGIVVLHGIGMIVSPLAERSSDRTTTASRTGSVAAGNAHDP